MLVTFLLSWLVASSALASPLDLQARAAGQKRSLNIDFTKYKVGTSYDNFLAQNGLYISSYKVEAGDSPTLTYV